MLKPAFIDLSHHNVIPASLATARASGILGSIHKLTEASGFVDDKCAARYFLAKEAGMLWGVYHFVRPGNMPQQVDFFLDQAELVSDADTLYCLDWEDSGVSLSQALDFLQRVEAETGCSPILYSGHTVKEALGGKPNAELSKYRLWLAQYSASPTLPP